MGSNGQPRIGAVRLSWISVIEENDVNGDSTVRINDLIASVTSARHGCPG